MRRAASKQTTPAYRTRDLVGTAERRRLLEPELLSTWRHWGPYLSDRQWGTVREWYDTDKDPWTDLVHDEARSRAYRWGEDGILGICDQQALLCFSVAMWNETDAIVKERLFGLTGPEGNPARTSRRPTSTSTTCPPMPT